jgi:hypothetical protein
MVLIRLCAISNRRLLMLNPIQHIMVKTIIILVVVIMLCSISTFSPCQSLKAKTEDGTGVKLLPDGTWEYETTEEPQSLPSGSTAQRAKTVIKGKRGTYGIWIDEDKWRMLEVSSDPAAELSFSHTTGNGYAMVIDEMAYRPFEELRSVALENIKKTAPDAKITYEEKRSSNGTTVLYLKIEGTVQSIPTTFLGYYYSGEAGTIQIVTYAAQDVIDTLEPDCMEFLSGFELYTPTYREINLTDGSKYKGSIVNGKMHGSGTYTWPNGDQYVGEFIENRASGGWLYKSDGRTVWCYQDEQGIWIIKEH